MAENTIEISTTAAGLFQSIRGFKYALHEAISDIVDNSVDASAAVIHIDINGESIIITDDGLGMSHADLEAAATPWKNAGKKQKEQGMLGKYGVGLKSAGFSLGDEIIIHTKKKGATFYSVSLKLNTLQSLKTNEIPCSTKQTELWKESGLECGTIIQILGINKRKVRTDQIDQLKNRLGITFYGMLAKKDLVLHINGTVVEPLNPLLKPLEKNERQNRYHAYANKTLKIKNEEGEEVSIKLSGAYIGRSFFWSDDEKKKFRSFLSTGASKGVKIDEQGLYISRNGRLITLGGWHGFRPFSHHHAPCRILIELHEDADSLIGIDHTKTKPEFEKHVIDMINQKYINEIFTDCEALFRKEGKDLKKIEDKKNADKDLKSKNILKPTPVDLMMEKEDKVTKALKGYQEREELLDKQITEDLQDEYWSLQETLPYEALWAPKINKQNEVTVIFNESHPGYSALFYEDDEDKVRQNLTSFFYHLATYEAQFSEMTKKLDDKMKAEIKKTLEAYRRYVSKSFREFD